MIGKLLGEFYLLCQLFVGSPTEINKPRTLEEIISYINNRPKQVHTSVPASCDGPLKLELQKDENDPLMLKFRIRSSEIIANGYNIITFYFSEKPADPENPCRAHRTYPSPYWMEVDPFEIQNKEYLEGSIVIPQGFNEENNLIQIDAVGGYW